MDNAAGLNNVRMKGERLVQGDPNRVEHSCKIMRSFCRLPNLDTHAVYPVVVCGTWCNIKFVMVLFAFEYFLLSVKSERKPRARCIVFVDCSAILYFLPSCTIGTINSIRSWLDDV